MAPSTVVPRSTLCCRCVSCSAKTVAFSVAFNLSVEGTSGDPRGFWVSLSKPSWFSNLNQGHWSSLWPAPSPQERTTWIEAIYYFGISILTIIWREVVRSWSHLPSNLMLGNWVFVHQRFSGAMITGISKPAQYAAHHWDFCLIYNWNI